MILIDLPTVNFLLTEIKVTFGVLASETMKEILRFFSSQKTISSACFLSKGFNQTRPQGYNARKVISELYASFVLQCTVTGR